MRQLHAIAGVMRSGSTLLCNILNQNPEFYASDTSHIPIALANLSKTWTATPEVKAHLLVDREGTEHRMRTAMGSFVQSWYSGAACQTVFDKSRLWNHNIRLFEWLYPESKMIVCVRDLTDVFASVEKQHAATAIFDSADTPMEKTMLGRADAMFSPDGIVGQTITGIDDLLRRKPKCVHVIQYERLVTKPKTVMRELYEELDIEYFEGHNFDSVEQTSLEWRSDGLYHHKFPHDGTGKVETRKSDTDEWVSPDVAGMIAGKFRLYNSAFGYAKGN